MNRLRKTSKRTDNPKKAITIKSQRILYGTIAILGIVALAVVVRIWQLQPSTAVSQPQTQPTLSVQQTPPTFLTTPLPGVAYSVEAESLFASLNCLCGTCNDTLAKCDCGVARQMKGYADSLVETSASKSEVMDRVVEKYGPEVLARGE